MKLVRIIVGELLLLGASILIFRSVWTLLDQYLGIDTLDYADNRRGGDYCRVSNYYS